MTRLGAHVPTSGGLAKRPFAYAEEIKAEAIQVFITNPRGWARSPGDPAVDALFREKAAEADLVTFVHSPFLVNLGSPNEATYLNSLGSVEFGLQRTAAIGALGLVVHTGSAVDPTFLDQAWRQIHEGMMPVLEAIEESDTFFLLEPTAGQGQSLCRKIEDLERYMEALEWHPRVGICLDTCHVFAAGHDISQPGGMTETIDLLISVVGEGRLKVIHANDSMDVCGALKDRHQNIGQGHIGSEAFRELLAHPAIADVPLILETPGNEPEHGSEITLLSSLRP
jgi:deoxyribonuclease IV